MKVFQLEPPPIHLRCFYAMVALFTLCFSSVFLLLPAAFLFATFLEGGIPWPLVFFTVLAVPFAAFLIFAGFRLRVWILPYRFTVDLEKGLCGYCWKEGWAAKTDIKGAISVVTMPGWSKRQWPWVLHVRINGGEKLKAILNSHTSCNLEAKALEDSIHAGIKIARYMEVPLEIAEWSQDAFRALPANLQTQVVLKGEGNPQIQLPAPAPISPTLGEI